MQKVRELKETYIARLKARAPTKVADYTFADFESRLNGYVLGLIRNILIDENWNELASLQTSQLIAKLSEKYPKVYNDHGDYYHLKLQMQRLLRENKLLQDIRLQENWAITKDHIKMFIFRTITTLMVAGVVLLTSYLAKLWDIPLPMLRSVI